MTILETKVIPNCCCSFSPFHVLSFGVITGSLGVITLLTQVNGLTALLGMKTATGYQ